MTFLPLYRFQKRVEHPMLHHENIGYECHPLSPFGNAVYKWQDRACKQDKANDGRKFPGIGFCMKLMAKMEHPLLANMPHSKFVSAVKGAHKEGDRKYWLKTAPRILTSIFGEVLYAVGIPTVAVRPLWKNRFGGSTIYFQSRGAGEWRF